MRERSVDSTETLRGYQNAESTTPLVHTESSRDKNTRASERSSIRIQSFSICHVRRAGRIKARVTDDRTGLCRRCLHVAAQNVRVANRYANYPGYRDSYVGFRLVRSVP